MYLEEVTATVIRESRSRGGGNLSQEEEEAIQRLIRDESIVIRPADKGSGIVILDTDDYLSKLEQKVHDDATYKSITGDKTSQVGKQVQKLVSGLHQKGFIGRHQRAYLIPARPQPGQLQGNPKLHKPGAPLRAIVSGRGHATERVAETAEEQLRSHVEGLESYVRDTADFLLKLRDTPQPIVNQCGHTPLLFCMDVKKLYPSVPRADGIEACRQALNNRRNPNIPTEKVKKMIEQFSTIITSISHQTDSTFKLTVLLSAPG